MDSDPDSSIYEEESEVTVRKRNLPQKTLPGFAMELGEVLSHGYSQGPCRKRKESQKRLPAMIPEERALLLELVVKYKDILESKKSDTLVILKKKSTWEKIAKEFSAESFTHPRPWEKLRKFWENVKRDAKSEVTKNVKARRKTGGGDAVEDLSAETELVCSIIPAQMKPMDNPWDSDGVNISSKNSEIATATVPSSTVTEPITEVSDCESIPSSSGSTSSKRKRNLRTTASGELNNRLKYLEKKKSDPRSLIVDLEHEEHAMRMKLLGKQLKTEDINYKIAVRKLEIMEEKNVKSIAILDAQLMNINSNNIVLIQ